MNNDEQINEHMDSHRFKTLLEKWLEYDRKIAKYREECHKIKNALIPFIKSNDLYGQRLHFENGDLKIVSENRQVSVSKTYIKNKLISYYSGDESKADKLVQFLYKNRPRHYVDKIVRIK